MKSNKKIVFLTIVVTAIVACWLMPGINTARQTRYTRIYENTGVQAVAAKPDSVPVHPETERARKKYIKESIEPDAQLEDIKAEMFSRALHFEEEIWDDTLVVEQSPITDTLYASKMHGPDSVYLDR